MLFLYPFIHFVSNMYKPGTFVYRETENICPLWRSHSPITVRNMNICIYISQYICLFFLIFFFFFALGTSKYYTHFSISENYMHNLKKYQKLRTQALTKPPRTSQRAMLKDPLSFPAPLKSFPLSLGGEGFQGRRVLRVVHSPKWGTVYE